MAVQITGAYRFNVFLKSKIKLGQHLPDLVHVVAATPQIALSVLKSQFGGDLQNQEGPIEIFHDGYTTMSGS